MQYQKCMVPIKIDCECGQRYAFEVEPLNGRMPSAIACPTCGADGTDAANDSISRQLSPTVPIISPILQPAPVAEPAPLPAQSISSASHRRPDPRLGLVSREQAEHEARAKAMWGDSREQIISYLMVQGFNHPEAMDMADDLFKERAAAVRSNGMGKMIKGGGLIGVAALLAVGQLAVGFVSTKLMGVAVLAAVFGAYLIIRGLLMVLAPKSEGGDVADQ